jgi:hypothetical protein
LCDEGSKGKAWKGEGMRKVKVFEMKQDIEKRKFEKVEIGIGKFHQFGMDFAEFETGPGNYSIAIIEMDDGNIKQIPVDMIQFIDKELKP